MPNILIVDDSKLSRNVIRDILVGADYEVVEAANGFEAIELVDLHTPDCILLDILMPEMDGFEVLKKLKEKGVTCPVIIHSADIQQTTRDKCFELGDFSFLNKPPEEEKLLGTIKEAITTGTNQ